MIASVRIVVCLFLSLLRVCFFPCCCVSVSFLVVACLSVSFLVVNVCFVEGDAFASVFVCSVGWQWWAG